MNNKKDFGCLLIKTQDSSNLLAQIDERIHLMSQIIPMNDVEDIDLLQMWVDFYQEITEMWLKDMRNPVIELNKLQEIKLLLIIDIVATFFTFNGDDTDKEFIKNANELFKSVNTKKKSLTLEERFFKLKQFLNSYP